jgi:putative inorganic carbon (HCO3(-)) transporter
MENATGKRYIASPDIINGLVLALSLSIPLILLTELYYIPFIIMGIIMGGVLMLRYPFIGLLVYSSYFFIRPQEFIPGLAAIPFEKPMAFLLLALALYKARRESGHILKVNNLDKSLVLFVGAALMSLITSIWISHSYEIWYKLFRLLIFYFLITRLISTKRQLKVLLMVIILSGAFHAAASTINYYNGIRDYSMGIYRAVGLDTEYGQPNSLAATLVYTLPFIYYYFTRETSRFSKILLISITPVILWCIILSGSRTGMMGVIFFVLLIVLESRHKFVLLGAGAIILLSTWAVMPDQYKGRFISTTDFSSQTGAAQSARGRIHGLTRGIEMLTDRPILGYGIGNFGTADAIVYKTSWLQAHNLYGQIMSELGMVGTIAFIIWMYYLFKTSKIAQRYFKEKDRFLYKTAILVRVQTLCLFFMGLGGHNMYRYNWFIASAAATLLLKFITEYKDKNLALKSVEYMTRDIE